MCLREFQFTPLSGVCLLTCIQTFLLSGTDGSKVSARWSTCHCHAVACPELVSHIYHNNCRESNNCSPLSSNKKFLGFSRNFKNMLTWCIVLNMHNIGLSHGWRVCQARLKTRDIVSYTRFGETQALCLARIYHGSLARYVTVLLRVFQRNPYICFIV